LREQLRPDLQRIRVGNLTNVAPQEGGE